MRKLQWTFLEPHEQQFKMSYDKINYYYIIIKAYKNIKAYNMTPLKHDGDCSTTKDYTVTVDK